LHVLQACARDAGHRVDVLYANIRLAAFIGERYYEQIAVESIGCAAEGFRALRVRLAAAPARGRRHVRVEPHLRRATRRAVSRLVSRRTCSVPRQRQAHSRSSGCAGSRREAPCWIEALARAIVVCGYPIVGCTTTFQQTTASIALLDRIKTLAPHTVTVLGGANCEGEMSEGLAALDTKIDYFFAGESEETFPAFVGAIVKAERPPTRNIHGRPCQDLDRLPFISSPEFFAQRAVSLPGRLRRRAPI
jgi:hypothetical protein